VVSIHTPIGLVINKIIIFVRINLSMTREFYVVVVFSIILLASCTQRMVCPAYQSAFIYDKDALRKKYSYFKEDSTPKILTASRNKHLIGVPVSYKKKVRTLETVPMKLVNPVVPDSLQEGFDKTEMDVSGVERNVNDSTAVIRIDTLVAPVQDSAYMISKEKEIRILKYDNMKRKYFVDTVGFNTEQDNYMWYLRDALLLPDVRIAKSGSGKEDEAKTEAGKKKKKGGFFKNLFKKKKKETEPLPDSTQQLKDDTDYGYDDFDGKVNDSTQVEQQQIQPDAIAPKKTKVKKKKTEKKKKETPPAKKEDEDDGF
jgi:hypothetical protein